MIQQHSRSFRPKWHYTPEQGWINDPNGLAFVDGRYHVFAQHHPYSTAWGPMHWSHATSHDLVSWDHQPIALMPDELGTIFSGGAVYDATNTSGMATPGEKPPLVLMFTHHGAAQQQSIAWSTDYRHFEKYPGNPVIKNPGQRDFRDPRPFWNPLLNSWSCAVAAGDHIAYYSSPDLLCWEQTGRFGPEGNHLAGVWECPDLFMLPVPGGEACWIQIVSMGRPKEQGGPCTQYFIGSFDGETFRPYDTGSHPLLVDPGRDFYAAVSFTNAPEPTLMGWGSNWVYAHETPTGVFRGALTLPRLVSLQDTPGGPRLAAHPCAALLDMLTLQQTSRTTLPLPHESFALRSEGEGPFTISLANDAHETLRFGLDSQGCWFIDRSQSSLLRFSACYGEPLYQMVRQPSQHKDSTAMLAVFDVSMLELFADDGLFACNSLVYPTQPYNRLQVSGAVTVSYLADPADIS